MYFLSPATRLENTDRSRGNIPTAVWSTEALSLSHWKDKAREGERVSDSAVGRFPL